MLNISAGAFYFLYLILQKQTMVTDMSERCFMVNAKKINLCLVIKFPDFF